jgi:hypothetical protein
VLIARLNSINSTEFRQINSLNSDIGSMTETYTLMGDFKMNAILLTVRLHGCYEAGPL